MQGIFHQAHDLSLTGNFIHQLLNVPTSAYIDHIFPSQIYQHHLKSIDLAEFLYIKKTIPGATYDSSARDPPPRSHFGTRLAIIQRCLDSLRNCDGVKKMLSVVDAAGVGKSAIMQDVTGSPISVLLHSSVLFSVDGTKAIITLSYRLAVKSKSYCQFITREIERDPSLVESSISIQFNEFITELFIHYLDLNSAGRALIIFDGLDECNGPHTARFPPPHL